MARQPRQRAERSQFGKSLVAAAVVALSGRMQQEEALAPKPSYIMLLNLAQCETNWGGTGHGSEASLMDGRTDGWTHTHICRHQVTKSLVDGGMIMIELFTLLMTIINNIARW